jgi:hypothetical protein
MTLLLTTVLVTIEFSKKTATLGAPLTRHIMANGPSLGR